MAWWWCFEKARPPQQPLPQEENPVVAKLKAAMDALPITVHRAAPKVGRNDPCPCGSGRKFKKCCGGLVVCIIVQDPVPVICAWRIQSVVQFTYGLARANPRQY